MSRSYQALLVMRRYFHYHLASLPPMYLSLDTTRMTVAYFALAALDLLSTLDAVLAAPSTTADPATLSSSSSSSAASSCSAASASSLASRQSSLRTSSQLDLHSPLHVPRAVIIQWLYSHQVLPRDDDPIEIRFSRCGFRGSFTNCSRASMSFLALHQQHSTSNGLHSQHWLDEATIAQTYSAIASLIICGDDLSQLHHAGIIGALRALQLEDGSFRAQFSGGEVDLRFLYCACAISALLQDWSGVNAVLAHRYIMSCQRYDGGFALTPNGEAHGGSTYLAVASLTLLGKLTRLTVDEHRRLLHWCLLAQGQGYQGRPNKPPDVCYSWWIGACVQMLDANRFSAPLANADFILRCADPRHGGFGKTTMNAPDILHSYMAVAGLSLIHHMMINDRPTAFHDAMSSMHLSSTERENLSVWPDWQLRSLDPRVGISLRANAAVLVFDDSL